MELTAGLVWLLVASALVLFMTPGLAFFYGGMTRAKSALNMMMMSFVAIGTVGITWVLWGASMATSNPDNFFQIVANPFSHFGLHNFTDPADLLKVGYAATFAIITVALISGAVADRAKFSAWVIFTPLWATLVYAPLAFMVWGGGLFSKDGWFGQTFAPVIDFAGGTVVHINAGVAGLVLAIIIGKRKGFGKEPMKPHNLTLVMLGAALLWFGWFGFNAGSAAAANGLAGLAWVNTTVATCGAMVGWLIIEKLRDGHATTLGAASGVVAGLVAITPAAGALSPVGSILLGVIAGGVCAMAVSLKYKLGYDDSLDVVGVHLVGGLIGTVGIGFFATSTGIFYGGNIDQLVVQILIALAAVVFSGVITTIIGLALKATMGWRIASEDEVEGIDVVVHGEQAYDFETSGSGHGVLSSSLSKSTAPTEVNA